MSGLKKHVYSSRLVSQWFFNPIQPGNFFLGLLQAFLALFVLLVQRSHCLDHSYWSISLFRLLLLVGPTIYDFCVKVLEAFCLLCMPGWYFFNHSSFHFTPISVYSYFKGCLYMFSYFLNFKNHLFNYHLKQKPIKGCVSAFFIYNCL
jgi:hypothetical protein